MNPYEQFGRKVLEILDKDVELDEEGMVTEMLGLARSLGFKVNHDFTSDCP